MVKLCGAIATGKLVKLERNSTSTTTRLATPVSPRSRRWRHAAAARGLFLSNNQIGDAGVAALAEAAGKLPQLKQLRLNGNPNISQQAKDALKAALPNCHVDI